MRRVTRRGTASSAWESHESAVAQLKASYDAIPAEAPVRLAKKTSNLFRPRARSEARGLDAVSYTHLTLPTILRV